MKIYTRICDHYGGKVPHAFDWYYHYSPFGVYFINLFVPILEYDVNVRECWDEIADVLKKVLPTYEDVSAVMANLSYLNKRQEHKVKEYPVFVLMQMYRHLNGSTTFNELMNMEYKTFLKFIFLLWVVPY